MSIHTLSDLKSKQNSDLKRLKIPTGISTFPSEILTFSNTLTLLDLSGNTSLNTLPSTFSQLSNLKIAFFSDCSFKTFPAILSQCRSLEMIAFKNNGMREIPENAFPKTLRWLILTGNEIEKFPASTGECERLEKCMLAGNRLKELPSEMERCRKLGLLRLSCNDFEELPGWLFGMPELAFLSFAGNPCCLNGGGKGRGGLEEIEWRDLRVEEVLGEGASGLISRGIWTKSSISTSSSFSSSFDDDDNVDNDAKVPATTQREVAIKLFKGTLTSDGSPLDELNICILAGSHENLISPLGSIISHPDNKRGLVLELVPSAYKNLGLPPTLQTCTRDVFPEGMVLSVRKCMDVLLGIATAGRWLHGRAVCHGDLYAHNVLVDFEGEGEGKGGAHALLGDFGAGSGYAWMEERMKGVVERIEVRGFGYLVEDLLGLVERSVGLGDGEGDGVVLDEKIEGIVEGLERLCGLCTGSVVKARPGFQEICEILEGL